MSVKYDNNLLTAIIDRFDDKEIEPNDEDHSVSKMHVLV